MIRIPNNTLLVQRWKSVNPTNLFTVIRARQKGGAVYQIRTINIPLNPRLLLLSALSAISSHQGHDFCPEWIS